jgi:hypothetical protein
MVNIPTSYLGGLGLKSRPSIDWWFRGFSPSLQVMPGAVPENYAMTASFHIISNLSFTYHQPPIQWVPGILSSGVKRGRDVTPWRLHGVAGQLYFTFLRL